MNKRRTAKDWESIAKEFGCVALRDLLYKYYVEKRMTTRQIGQDVLDVSEDRVVQLLKTQGIPLRKRGGIR
jgi:hypothetical protein